MQLDQRREFVESWKSKQLKKNLLIQNRMNEKSKNMNGSWKSIMVYENESIENESIKNPKNRKVIVVVIFSFLAPKIKIEI